MAVISLVAGCNKIDDLLTEDSVELKSAQTHTVTVPFEANLLGEYKELIFEDPECLEDGFFYHAVVEAQGTATHMGKVSITLSFCVMGPDDPEIPGADNKYAGGSYELVAANGDKLFLNSEGGSVIDGRTDDHPEYVVAYWQDKFTITGGTGRFKGASGELQMDDYSTNIDTYSHHQWFGKITLVKGKR